MRPRAPLLDATTRQIGDDWVAELPALKAM
jgi:hypothetical protein